MIVDQQIQMQDGWGTHAGGNIGGVAPAIYGVLVSPPGNPTARLFYTAGSSLPGGYADVEHYVLRPLLPNTGNLTLSFDLMVDGNAAKNAQAEETDTILCVDGYNYNFSVQINVALGGVLQVANAGGSWVSIGSGPRTLAPHMWHRFVIAYNFDTVKHVGSVMSISIDGVNYAVPPIALRNVPAQLKNWADGALFQVQQDLTAAAGEFAMLIDNAQYMWS